MFQGPCSLFRLGVHIVDLNRFNIDRRPRIAPQNLRQTERTVEGREWRKHRDTDREGGDSRKLVEFGGTKMLNHGSEIPSFTVHRVKSCALYRGGHMLCPAITYLKDSGGRT